MTTSTCAGAPRRPGTRSWSRRRPSCGTPRHPPANAAPSTASAARWPTRTASTRLAAVYTLLANTRGATLPYVLLRLLIGTFLRVLAYLVGKVPGQALDELAGLFGTLLRPGKILAARKRRGRPAVEASELRPLFPPPGATVRATAEQVAGNLAGRAAPDVASATATARSNPGPAAMTPTSWRSSSSPGSSGSPANRPRCSSCSCCWSRWSPAADCSAPAR